MQVEYDPRSESFRVWVSNEKEYHFMRLIGSPAFDPLRFLKCNLNSIYGKMVTETGIYADTDSIKYGKENDNMTRDYIVVHDDGEPMIIFKRQIVCISKDDDRACIYCTNGCYNADESYASVVKQLV